MKRWIKWFLVLALLLLLFRPVVHFLCQPWEIHSSWVETLATADSGLRNKAELRTLGKDSKEVYQNQKDFDRVLKANEQKRRLYEKFKSGSGKLGLFRRSSTVEGRPIFHWLVVDEGNITYVHDHSRDDGAWPWAVDILHPKEMQIGFLEDGQFVEGEPAATNSPIIVLQMNVGRFDPVRFY